MKGGCRQLARAAVAAVLVALLAAPPVAAQTDPARRRSQIQSEIERLRGQVDEAAAEEAQLLAELEVSRRAEAELVARVAELDAQVAVATAELAEAEAGLAAAEAQRAEAAGRLAAARVELNAAVRELQALAVAAYIDPSRSTGRFDVLLRVRDMRQLHDATELLQSSMAAQQSLVERRRALEREVEELAARAEEARAAAVGHRDAVAARRAEIEAARREQDTARADAAAERRHQEALVAEARTRRGSFERRIRQLQAESEQIAALLRRRQAGQQAGSGSGQLAYPLRSAVVTSSFGRRVHPIFGTSRLHAGIDMRAATGEPVFAAGAGTVVSAGWYGGYGNAVVVDHGGSLATLYAHLSSVAVRPGQRVRRGQTVGAAGSTGFSTGPHLHFEVRVNGTPVEPRRYL